MDKIAVDHEVKGHDSWTTESTSDFLLLYTCYFVLGSTLVFAQSPSRPCSKKEEIGTVHRWCKGDLTCEY